VDGNLHSLQFIAQNGEKRFLTGGRKSGCFFVIGKSGMLFAASGINPSGKNLVGEGFATMASCHAAEDCPAVIAFDAGNIKPVAEALGRKYPEGTFVFCADDDAWTEGNPGKTKALEAAEAVGGRVALPAFSGERQQGQSDFNDLHQIEGLDAVRRCFEGADEIQSEVDLDTEIDRLARLKALDYERVREADAKRLGVRVSVLDEARKERQRETENKTGAEALVGDVEPWPEAVNV
jgi:putative DNA primase/helicase